MKILIAGASGGIGKYLAEHLSTKHIVYGTYNTRKPDVDLDYHMNKVDVTNESDVARWVSTSTTDSDELVLIYCVGVNYNCMIHKSDAEKWRKVIESNLFGVQHFLRHLLPKMRAKCFGRIVLLSSVVPQIGVPGTSAYAASKSALWGLSKTVAKEIASSGITINTVNLGYFDIGMIHEVPPDILEEIVDSIPMRRLGNPENILNAVEFILSTDYLTGTGIDLNGGLY